MTSMFDSSVYQRRKQTPWAKVNFLAFAKEMVLNGDENETDVVLKVKYRHDSDTRFWYSLSWVGEDGRRREVYSKEFDLCLWRAAQVELDVREEIK